MTKPIGDISNVRFGKLTALRISDQKRKGSVLWDCICDCGNRVLRKGTALRRSVKRGFIPECGIEGAHTYGGTQLHRAYWNMVNRCNCSSSSRYSEYGGRGITVCSEWMEGYPAFEAWALANGFADGLSLERVRVNEGYSPDNCKWIPLPAQAYNKQNTRRLTWNGKTQSAVEWAHELGVPVTAIQLRITRRWTTERIFTQPYRAPR